MALIITTGIFALCLLLFLFRRTWRNHSFKFPPGPRGLPFLGSVFAISPSNPHKDFRALSKQYGDVISLNMAGNRIVVLNSANAIKDAFVSEESRDAFAGRPETFYVRYCDRGPATFLMDYGDIWRIQRQFLIKTLKIFDDNNHTIERIISEELAIVVQEIKDTNGESFDIRTILMPSLVNVLLILTLGERYDYDHPAVQTAMAYDVIDAKMLGGQSLNILTAFPFLRFLPFGYGKFYREHQQCLENFLYYTYEIAKKTYDPSTTRGFVDKLFKLQPDNPWLKDDNIRGMVKEVFGGGLGTTRSTLCAFFLIILHEPEVMTRIQKEIDSVIGRDRAPKISDRGHMPYTEAVLMELLRYVTVAPLGAPHKTTRDVEFRDYILPKNTVVIPNIWAAHHDERVWDEPWVYRPERFLDERGELLPVGHKNRKHWLAFGAGRRSCLGETFGRCRVFLFMTTLLQHFNFLPCGEEPLPPHDPRGYDAGITIHAPPFKLRAIPRII